MTLKLFYSPGACSLAAHILLEESGLPYEAVRASIPEGATASEWFRRMNPKGRVPVLVIDDEVLTELPAISWYIAARARCGLLPSTAMAQARMLEWFNWLSGTVHSQGFGALWRPARYTANAALHAELGRQARATLAACFDDIDARLHGGPWALQEHYSPVDPLLLVIYRWSVRIGHRSWEQYPTWTRHARNMLARPAVQRAFAQEGLDPAEIDPGRRPG